MGRKPLIVVSLCAVLLLIFASLTHVVGYSSIKSTLNDSPLFDVRTQRATHQQHNILTSQYLGLGKETTLQFPNRDNTTESLNRVIELISKMDDTSFKRLTELCIQKIKQDDIQGNKNVNKISQAFNRLRKNPEIIMNSVMYEDNFFFASSPVPGVISCDWFPGCLLLIVLLDIFYYIIFRQTAAVICHSILNPCNVT